MSKALSPVTKSDLPSSHLEWVGSNKCAEAPPSLHPTNPLSSTGKEEGPWMNRDSGPGEKGTLSPSSQAEAQWPSLHSPGLLEWPLSRAMHLTISCCRFPRFNKHFLSPYLFQVLHWKLSVCVLILFSGADLLPRS